jgi:hypothetical protein
MEHRLFSDGASTPHVLGRTATATEFPMLRKVLWSGLYAVFGALATIAARTAASKVWRIATGEQPPAKK